MPARGWRKPNAQPPMRFYVTVDLASEIRQAMKEDGEKVYVERYIRKLIRHGLAFRNLRVV